MLFRSGGNNTPLVQQPMAIGFDPTESKANAEIEVSPTLRGVQGGNAGHHVGVAVQQPIVLMDQGGGVMQINTDGKTGTLRRETHGHEPVVLVQEPMAFSPQGRGDMRGVIPKPTAQLQRCQVEGVIQPIGLDEEQNARVDGFGCLKARTEGGGFEGTDIGRAHV